MRLVSMSQSRSIALPAYRVSLAPTVPHDTISVDMFLNSPWDRAQNATIKGDIAGLEQVLREHPELRDKPAPPYVPAGPSPSYSEPDAASIIAREHFFDTFAEFAKFAEKARDKNSPVGQFESAVDAIVTGNLAAVRSLLRENSQLVQARSLRRHQATLLHYVGANGVEGFRQRTPPNAVTV